MIENFNPLFKPSNSTKTFIPLSLAETFIHLSDEEHLLRHFGKSIKQILGAKAYDNAIKDVYAKVRRCDIEIL